MSLRTVLPWVTTATGASVMYLAAHARTRKAAWILGIANQVPWISFAVITHSWGFVPGSLLYGGVYIRNLLRGDHR
jgi:hypothetical protein